MVNKTMVNNTMVNKTGEANSNDQYANQPMGVQGYQKPYGSILIGRICELSANGNPLVSYDDATQLNPVEALSTVPLDKGAIGCEVAISFAQNQGGVPVIMGVIARLIDQVMEQTDTTKDTAPVVVAEVNTPELLIDGKKIQLSATEEISLRCGDTSITLNKNGKILVQGKHMLNRIAGSYQIKSGSIDLN